MINDITEEAVSYRFMLAFTQLWRSEAFEKEGDFCEKVGIAQANFSKIKKGERTVPAKAVYKMVEVFSVSPNWLLRGEGPMLFDLEEEAYWKAEGEKMLENPLAQTLRIIKKPDQTKQISSIVFDLGSRIQNLSQQYHALQKELDTVVNMMYSLGGFLDEEKEGDAPF